MAARTRRTKHNDKTREKIKTSQLINRLMKHVLGKVEMQPTQVTAALGLLKKSLPDLTSATVEGDMKNYHYVVDSKPMTEDEWSSNYEDSVAPSSGASESTH